MTTSPAPARVPLRISLRESPPPGEVVGAWWPQSRDLQVEAADLIDHLPASVGYVNRLLFSRPDWDDCVERGRGTRRVHAARGPVKVGSFPGDDTGEMVLALASGKRVRLLVVPPATDVAEADRLMGGAATPPPARD
jgi:hypothetical protein